MRRSSALRSALRWCDKPAFKLDPGFSEHLRLSPRAILGPGARFLDVMSVPRAPWARERAVPPSDFVKKAPDRIRAVRPAYARLDEGCSDWPSRASMHRGRTMGKHRLAFVAFDSAKDKHAVAIADDGRDGEVHRQPPQQR